MPGFRVRKATIKDIPVLVEHRNAMFEEYHPMTLEERAVAEEAYPVWARKKMGLKLFHGYIVETAKGRVAASGCVWLREVQPSQGRSASLVPYLMSIYTGPRFRRKGLASVIVKETMAWARKHGYSRMTLHASPMGRKVYSRLGWKRTWEMEVRLDGPPAPALEGAKGSGRTRRPSRSSKRPPPARGSRPG